MLCPLFFLHDLKWAIHQSRLKITKILLSHCECNCVSGCVEMEKDDQKWEQPELEEPEEEEETPLVVRKSRNDSKTTQVAEFGVEVSSNGISESDGHKIESEVAANGAQHEETIIGEEHIIVGEFDAVSENEKEANNLEKRFDGILENKQVINGEKALEELDEVFENKSAAVNGEKKSEELDGVSENGSEATNGEQKPESIVFYDKAEGVESASTYFGEKQIGKDPGQNKYNLSSGDFIYENTSSATNNGHKEDIQEDNFPSYNSSKEIESAEPDQINDDDLEINELEVERVIKKQTTHDLYCPNCNSCITKRVVLRKRKRTRISEEEAKRNKIEGDSKLISGTVPSTNEIVRHTDEVGDNDTQQPAAEGDERERGPDVFRCLSCFSIFIPTGNGYKLFGKPVEKSRKETIRDERAPAVKKNWFTSIFAPNKQETTVEQGSSSQINVQNVSKNDVGSISSSKLSDQSSQPSVSQKARDFERPVVIPVNNDTLEGTDKVLPSPRQEPPLKEKLIDHEGDIEDVKAANTTNPTMEQSYGGSYQSATTLPKITQVSNGESQQDVLKLLISSNKGPQALSSLEEGQISNHTIQSVDTELPPVPVSIKASDEDGQLNISVSIPHEEQEIKTTIITETVLENKNANFTSSNGGQIYQTETKFEVHSGEPLRVDNISPVNGKDAIITIDAQPPVPSVTPPTETPSVTEPETQIDIADRERTEARKELQIEVLKSIVYGGLAESITSLSIVSSAAGGGANTLNVLALGLANLIGGLFIICHNLWDLKCERVVENVSTQVADVETNPRDRYKELLGRRQNFVLHAVVAVISYLVFGLVPPLIYAFSFRNSNDKQLKLLVVAAASLICIVMLATGRAHVRCRPRPYFQSITTFFVLGFMVSGVSYAAGGLVERLLEKLGWFESGSVGPQMMMMTGSSGSGRASF